MAPNYRCNCYYCGKPICVNDTLGLLPSPFEIYLCPKCYTKAQKSCEKSTHKKNWNKCWRCEGSGRVKGYICQSCDGRGGYESTAFSLYSYFTPKLGRPI
jgi:hypothetical protein